MPLQLTLIATALLPLTTGFAAFLLGPRAIFGARGWDAPIESEVRYLSVWWFASGVALLRAVPRVEDEARTVRRVGLLLALGGVGRLLAMRAAGRPHPIMVGATAVEIALPALLISWQARVARQAGERVR